MRLYHNLDLHLLASLHILAHHTRNMPFSYHHQSTVQPPHTLTPTCPCLPRSKCTKPHKPEGRGQYFCETFWSGRHMPGCKLNSQLPGYCDAALALAEEQAREGRLTQYHSLSSKQIAGLVLVSPDAISNLHKTDLEDEGVAVGGGGIGSTCCVPVLVL